jgi:hypothetical protein
MQKQAYINGFVKRANEYGFNDAQAIELLNKAAAPRWEKELRKMPPDRAKEAIIRIARSIPNLTGDISPRNLVSRSKSLLSHQLIDAEEMNIPSTIMRLKETIRDMLKADSGNIKHKKLSNLTDKQKKKRLMSFRDKQSKSFASNQAETFNIDPEAEVPFIHGGGESFLKRFLEGKEKGYRLENDPRKGIQVHGHNPGGPNPLEHEFYINRTNSYANRGALGNFDSPAKLIGRVKAKNLFNAVNDYEHAIVDPSHIIDPVISRLPINKEQLPYLGADETRLLNTLTPIRKVTSIA